MQIADAAPDFVIVSETVKFPVLANLTCGFCEVVLVPFTYVIPVEGEIFHDHPVGLPREVSENVTTSPAHISESFTVKPDAIGAYKVDCHAPLPNVPSLIKLFLLF